MKNCSNCIYRKFNFVDDFENKIFMCDRNRHKKFNYPKLHGLICRHYAQKVIHCEMTEKALEMVENHILEGRSKDVRED